MATTKSRTPDGEAGVARELRVAVTRLHRQLRARTLWNLTPSQASALARIDQLGPLRGGVLAEHEGMAPATISKIVDSLVREGLVERVDDPTDRRASLLRLSARGAATLEELRTRGTELVRDALGALSSAEREALEAALPALERLSDQLSTPTSAKRVG
jgi:DNA-binding MarR family transcriptional regulator